MAFFEFGPIIKNRREELGFSQEDLADGICSVPTLSRIENGERMPTKNHLEQLLQRLGYSATSVDYYSEKRIFLAHDVKMRLRNAYMAEDFELAKMLYTELADLLTTPSKADEQFLILYDILLYQKECSPEEKLKGLENALTLTCPRYSTGKIPSLLSYEEIILLNNIAICNSLIGNSNRAIFLLYSIKEYYEHHVISADEALRTQPMILYNLSKILGLSGRYDECIEICDIGIRIARRTGRCSMLGETLYNRAWALIQRNHAGDKAMAENTLKQAIYFSMSMENERNIDLMKNYYKKSFGRPISV